MLKSVEYGVRQRLDSCISSQSTRTQLPAVNLVYPDPGLMILEGCQNACLPKYLRLALQDRCVPSDGDVSRRSRICMPLAAFD